jgi:DNA invertase Pin-like site-specific DNA recombinase
MRKAALYVRASTDHQKYSTTNQIDALSKYAEERAIEIVSTYEDAGRSGLSLTGRLGLRQLLQDVLAGRPSFDVILVYDVSRWGRFQDTDEAAYYEFLCKRAGVPVIYCAELFDNDGSPLAAVVKGMKRAMAAEYSRELSVKTSAGKRAMAKRGFHQGTYHCLGLQRILLDSAGAPKGVLARGENKNLKEDRVILGPGTPKEVALIRRIFRLLTKDGLRVGQISTQLNREGIPSPMGVKWGRKTIMTLLMNERYIGNSVYNKTTCTLRKRPVQNPPAEWIRHDGAWQGIVSLSTFRKAQAILTARSRRPSDEDMLAPLEALLNREGTLTSALINAEPGMSNSGAYKYRFNGLLNAYRRIGFLSPMELSHNSTRSNPSPWKTDQMLALLKALYLKDGYLTAELVNSTPGMPASYIYQSRFNGLTKAYLLVGYTPDGGWQRSRRARAASHFGQAIL